MAKLPIHKVGGAVDTSELTAVPGDVLTDESFIGAGSDDPQTGTIIKRGSPAYSLPINGTQQLQAGHYSGGAVSQSIPTLGAQNIGPGSKMITIPTAGKYMTGNITIKPVYNLSTSVIKKGEYVGGVGPGTWEGYVNTDPKVPYYYGAFNGIQTITSFKDELYNEIGTVSLEKDHIEVRVTANYRYTVIAFNAPINFDNLSSLMVRFESSLISSGSGSTGIEFLIYRNLVTDYMRSNGTINPNLGTLLASGGDSGTGGDLTKSVASVTGNAYLYLRFAHPGSVTKVKIVRFD